MKKWFLLNMTYIPFETALQFLDLIKIQDLITDQNNEI